MEEITSLIQTVTALIGVLVWPFVVIFLIYYFGKPLKVMIARVGEFSFKAGPTGIEASAKVQELKEKLLAVNINTTSESQIRVANAEKNVEPTAKNRIDHRHEIEERNREVFLVHVIKPSESGRQWFDVFIYLKKHRSDDLSDVSYAEFFLGKNWANKVFKVENRDGLVGISISVYGPVLCTCRVVFKDGYEVMLDRYIDFEMVDVVYKRK
jgi:hypothetical protein